MVILFVLLMFDILHMAHINCGHGCLNRMEHSIKQKYKTITSDIILLYLQLCNRMCYYLFVFNISEVIKDTMVLPKWGLNVLMCLIIYFNI